MNSAESHVVMEAITILDKAKDIRNKARRDEEINRAWRLLNSLFDDENPVTGDDDL